MFDVPMTGDQEKADELLKIAYEHQMKGRLNEAIEWYTRSIEACPTAEAHTFLGWTYSFLGRFEDAIEECKKAIEADPTFGNPYNDIGAYLIELGRPEEGIEWLEKATTAARYEPRHFPHFNLARVYARIWRYDKAIEHLRKAIELEPGYDAAKKELKKLIALMN